MRILIISLFAISLGCSSGRTQTAVQNTNTASEPMRAEKLQTTTAHTTENQPPKPADASIPTGGKWSQSGEPIDTAKFDAAIASAEKSARAKPDEAAKKALAQAFFERGFALTEARQYASALGDYRRALKQDPMHEESQKWIDQIVGIYAMLKKEYPKEGEEPPPLEFKREKAGK